MGVDKDEIMKATKAFSDAFEERTKYNPDALTRSQIMQTSFLQGINWGEENLFTSEDMYKYAIFHVHNSKVLSPKEWKERQ